MLTSTPDGYGNDDYIGPKPPITVHHIISAAEAISRAIDTIASTVPGDSHYPIELDRILHSLDSLYSYLTDDLHFRYRMTREEISDAVHCPVF